MKIQKMSKLTAWMQNKLLNKNYVVLNYNIWKGRAEIMPLIRGVIKDGCKMKASEIMMIYNLVKKLCSKKSGNLVEVGSYNGGSAKIICEAKGDNLLYVYDTFEGLKDVNKSIDFGLKNGQFSASYDGVKKLLSPYKNVKIIKGFFPECSEDIIDKKFIFVHLDVDTYQSTYNCLSFFYGKMEDGGVIISHDYSNLPGVRRAFDDFFMDKEEIIIELEGSQGLMIKK